MSTGSFRSHSMSIEEQAAAMMKEAVEDAFRRVSIELRIPVKERALAEEAIRLAQAESRTDDKVVQSLVAALNGLLDFRQDAGRDSGQMTIKPDDPQIGAAWRSAMRMAVALVDLKRSELPTLATSAVRTALDEIGDALHAAHDQGPAFKRPDKLGRHKPRTPKPPPPLTVPRTMREGILAELPSDGTPVLRTAVESAVIGGGLAVSKRSASREFLRLVGEGRISETGVRGRTMVALTRRPITKP